jgi:hypothetical protein
MRASKFHEPKSSDVALAIPSDSGVLIEPGERPSADMTARLLFALTALYVQRPSHTAEEQQQYSELALRLIDKVEAATRTAVAGILQRHPDAPAEVAERLSGAQSSCDCDPKREPHSAADRHGAGNQRLNSDPHLGDGQSAGTEASFDAPAIGQPPPHAGEGRERTGEAFFAASPAERRRLLTLMARGYCDDVPGALEDRERAFGSVDAAALHGRFGEFTGEFERLIDIPRSLCERIVNDPSGEPMVVAAKAAAMPIAVLQRMLLLVCAAATHSVERVYDLTELYHDLDGRAARDLLVQWRMQAKSSNLSPEMEPDIADRRPGGSRPPPSPPPLAGEGRVGVSLRSRFSALTERVRSQAVSARRDRGSVARPDLRSR